MLEAILNRQKQNLTCGVKIVKMTNTGNHCIKVVHTQQRNFEGKDCNGIAQITSAD